MPSRSLLARLLVQNYFFVHGKLHLPGAGWLLRRMAPWCSGLRAYPLEIPNVGTAVLNFGDESAYGILNTYLGEHDDTRELIECMGPHLKPGAVLWDVGANVGFLSMHLLTRHPGLAAIHAFEPNPRAYQPLQTLFQKQPKVKVHPFGLGRRDEQLEMSASPSASTLGSVARKIEGGESLQVVIRNGDACVTELKLPLPDVLKVDVEGFEPEVFAGLAATIQKKRPVIFFEHFHLSEEQIRQCIPPGYQLKYILKGGGVSADISQRVNSSDVILLPEAPGGA